MSIQNKLQELKSQYSKKAKIELNYRIIHDHEMGESYSKLARKYDVTSTRIGHIVNKWKPIFEEEGLI